MQNYSLLCWEWAVRSYMGNSRLLSYRLNTWPWLDGVMPCTNSTKVVVQLIQVRLCDVNTLVRSRAHQGNWQPKCNRNFRELVTA
jgi:hypothetical protein